MQPTFRHVPPRAPRFSIHATCISIEPSNTCAALHDESYLHAFLPCFYSSDIAGNATPNDDEIMLRWWMLAPYEYSGKLQGIPASVA